MAEKISGVYKITNTITGDFYIGSSKNVKERWAAHKCQSRWNDNPNNPMYLDMKKYGVDKFVFEILAEVEVDSLKKTEQEFIEKLQPTYNNINAKGLDIERYNEYRKEYNESHKEQKKQYYESNKEEILEQKKQYYESHKEQKKQYYESHKEQKKQYYESNKEQNKQYQNKYNNQLCFFNGQTLTLNALSMRFRRRGIEHPTIEAKKYLLEQQQ